MARRTKEDAQTTREGILDAAEDCFRENGLFRTSLEAIAAKAGVTRGAVYWHFKNKAEVLEAMINRVTVPFFHGLEHVSRPDGTTPLRDLREMMRQSFADLVHNPRVRSALEVIELRCEVPVEDDAVTVLRKTGMRKTHARITAAFKRAEALGQLREGLQAESCARSLHFIIGGALRLHLLDPETVDLERDGLAAVDLALQAIAREPLQFPDAS
ncbi:TetR family transcriptional regulator [Luteimonas terricola]|uniref:TetR family transcriptional regulator n=1 Tax=Luteimonas terricola TaxID=645597 RepID=A0ABQ2E8S8_9GAMM|nr:TetR family transcriptional regulator [Luteimonas terricola]GGJ97591.1 TetR family transcriptional regulator [Luteimonas terricola]